MERRYIRISDGKPSNMEWSPRFQIEYNATGLKVKVSPPFKTAAYHKICVDQNRICIGGMLQVNKTNGRYLQGFVEVPSNQTYQIMIKPFDKNGNELDSWVTNKNNYFYQPILPEVTDGPVRERLNHTSTLPPPELTQSNHTVLIILLIVAITCLLVMSVIFFFLHRHRCTKKPFKFLQKICQGEKKGEEERFKNQIADKPGVAIIPIFLQQPEKEKRMVEAHLTLLEKQDGITIKPTPFLSDLKLQEVEEGVDISTWVDEQINMAVQHDNHYFIVYASDDIKIILTEPDMFPENPADQICIRFIQKLTSQNLGKKVLGVYFGTSVDYNCLPFTKCYRMFAAVKVDSEELHPPPVSFSGTVDLINCLLASQTDKQYSLNSDETRNLRSIFLHPQQFMSRSSDGLTTGYESDCELCPFIHDNGTFVSPDSIAGSQHSDLNAEMDGLNRRAGWPDVC